MGKMGKEIADLVGPPDEEDLADGGDDEAEEGDDPKGGQEEAEVSAAKDFQEATKNGTPEEVLSSLKDLLDLVG